MGSFCGNLQKKQKTSDSDGKSIARRPHSTPPSLKYWPREGARNFAGFPSPLVSVPLKQIQVRELDEWLAVSRWPRRPNQHGGRVDEIAGQIMLLADASLITALLSISNYTGCLAEREGRWTSYWKSLYWQYSHQAVMASPPPPAALKQTFFPAGSSLPAAQAGFHFSCLIRGYFTPGMQSERN